MKASSGLDTVVTHLGDALDTCGLRWAIIGSAGMVLLTQENENPVVIDVAVWMDSAASVAHFTDCMREHEYLIGRLLEDQDGNITNIRMARTAGGPTIDVHLRSTGLEEAILGAAVSIEVPGAFPAKVRVARLGHIAAVEVVERNSPRHERSEEFLVGLLAKLSPEELKVAADALREVSQTARFAGRDLSREMSELLG